MEEKQWIEEVLNSTNRIKRLTPDDSLLHTIEARINNSRVSPKITWMAAASIAAVIALNVAVLAYIKNSKTTGEKETTDSPFYTNNQIY